LQVIQRWRQFEDEISARECVFGVASIDRVSGENRSIAKVLHIFLAIPARAIDSPDPGDADAGSNGKLGCGSIDDVANDLMTWNKLCLTRRQFAFDDVQVGPANAASTYTQENVSGNELRRRNVGDLQRTLENILRGIQHSRFHVVLQVKFLSPNRAKG
jgi:hypothetical protein